MKVSIAKYSSLSLCKANHFTAKMKNNPNFKLYIIGYAHFFNADTDWCDTISFRYLPSPFNRQMLTQQLRADLNGAMDALRGKIKAVIAAIGDPRVKFIDINPFFEGHRFCEDGHTFLQQWYHNDIWLWNLNIVPDDPDNNPTVEMINNEQNLGEDAQGNAIVIPPGDDFEGANPDDEMGPFQEDLVFDIHWTYRTFHPKSGGHEAIKKAIIAQLRADNIPGVKQLVLPSTSPFAQGTCQLALTQTIGCTASPEIGQFVGPMTITDATGVQIGSISTSVQSGDNHPVLMGSKIDTLLSITPVGNGDYIQFDLGGRTSWRSDDSSHCSVPGWQSSSPCGKVTSPTAF